MFFIICYDTPSDRRRRKLHKLLKNYAVTVQKSVFETFLEGPRMDELLARIGKFIDPAVDSVRIYGMTRDAQRQMRIIGLPGMLEDPDHFIVSDGKPSQNPAEEKEESGEEADTELPAWL